MRLCGGQLSCAYLPVYCWSANPSSRRECNRCPTQGHHDRRRMHESAGYARDVVSDHERHRAEMGGHAALVQLHLFRPAEDRPVGAQDHAHRGGAQPAEQPEEAGANDVRDVQLPRGLLLDPGRAHALRAGAADRRGCRRRRRRDAYRPRLRGFRAAAEHQAARRRGPPPDRVLDPAAAAARLHLQQVGRLRDRPRDQGEGVLRWVRFGA
mmetsp:Transcript_49695/g.107650  ORF Transcript_49695/g.107650 Transcript_49695/m.107650 type:complete len:210 (+) Transcript_49695:207-836(+)